MRSYHSPEPIILSVGEEDEVSIGDVARHIAGQCLNILPSSLKTFRLCFLLIETYERDVCICVVSGVCHWLQTGCKIYSSLKLKQTDEILNCLFSAVYIIVNSEFLF